MLNTTFWKATIERAIKTFAQTLVAFWGADAFNIVEADWGEVLSLAAGAAVLSLLTSVGSSAVTSTPGPSLTNAEVLNPTGQAG
jgi:hypothetical protein